MEKRFVVTKGNGTFRVGDRIVFYKNGDIGCAEAGGWIDNKDAEKATKGMEYKPDIEFAKKEIKRLQEAISELRREYGIT
jgi:hypothetical protein